jgi:transposase-like protein
MLGNGPVRFGGRPHGKGPAQQAPRRAADPAVKVNGVWRYVYRAVDQYGQVIDVLVSARRDADAARRFLRRALSALKVTPSEVGHRRRRSLPRRARRADPVGVAPRRAVRQQPDRG